MAVVFKGMDEDPDAALLEQVHRQSVEATQELQAVLGRKITAYTVGVKDPKTITRWMKGEVTTIRPENEKRLRGARNRDTLVALRNV